MATSMIVTSGPRSTSRGGTAAETTRPLPPSSPSSCGSTAASSHSGSRERSSSPDEPSISAHGRASSWSGYAVSRSHVRTATSEPTVMYS